MFGTIRRHQKWLWWTVITVIVISFVIYFSPYSKMNSGGRRGPVNLGSVNGERITEEQYVNARQEIRLRYFLTISGGRSWPDEEAKNMGFDVDKETYKWLLLIQKEEQLGIHISDDQVAQIGRDLLRPFERSGPLPVDMFVTRILNPAGMQLADFERFCRHYLGIQELISTVGLGGKLVTPEEVRALYERQHQEVAAEAVFFSASNYVDKVTITPEAIAQFYTNQLPNYRIPDRVQVKYVEFGVSNFLGQARTELGTNLISLVETNLLRLGTNYTRFGKTPEEAKGKIREELLRSQALDDAKKKAKDFANVLLNAEQIHLEDLDKLAATNGLTVGTTAPFDVEDGPKDLEVQADFAKAAFSRTPEDPFAGPFVGQNGVYEISYYKRLPGENPTLDQVRERVTADFKFNQALNLAHMAGLTFYPALTNGMAQGKTFDAVCTEAKFKPVSLPPFSISTRSLAEFEDRANLSQLKEAAFRTPPGKASGFEWPDTRSLRQLTDPGGFILYVGSKLPLNPDSVRTNLPAFTDYVRQKQTENAFNLWFSKEAEKGLRDTPLFQQRPPPALGSSEGKS